MTEVIEPMPAQIDQRQVVEELLAAAVGMRAAPGGFPWSAICRSTGRDSAAGDVDVTMRRFDVLVQESAHAVGLE